MTLEDAKRKIKEKADGYDAGYSGLDEWHPEMLCDRYYEGKSDGLDEALMILEEVEA